MLKSLQPYQPYHRDEQPSDLPPYWSMGGHGSLPWLSADWMRPSFPWIMNSVPWLRLILLPASTACSFVEKCPLARCAPLRFTSQPPAELGTIWWDARATLLPPMCLRATSSATICIGVNVLCLCNGINLVTETADILFAVDTKFIGMCFSVYFMVVARIQSGVVVNIRKSTTNYCCDWSASGKSIKLLLLVTIQRRIWLFVKFVFSCFLYKIENKPAPKCWLVCIVETERYSPKKHLWQIPLLHVSNLMNSRSGWIVPQTVHFILCSFIMS